MRQGIDRNLEPKEDALRQEEQALLDRICEAYYLPAWCSINDYQALFRQHGLQASPLKLLSDTAAVMGCFCS